MKKIKIGILGYTKNYNKFLNNISSANSNYNINFIYTKKDLSNKLNKIKLINTLKISPIKFLVICEKSSKDEYINNLDFFIKKKIIIVQASTNHEIENHGFITQKLFKDYSFKDIFLRNSLKLNKNSINKFINNKKIIITGGAGSIGSSLVLNLLKYSPKLLCIIDNNEYNIFKLNRYLLNKYKKKIVTKIVNIDDASNLNSIFREIKPHIVYNTAALKHVSFLEDNPNQGLKINYLGTKNVLQASTINKVKFFIHVSTDKAANPINNLGISKLLSEIICKIVIRNSNTKVGIVRFGNVFDSYGSVSEIFKNNILNSKKIEISNPNVERFFMSKDEAADFLIYTSKLLLEKSKKGKTRTFIYEMGKPIKILDLAKKIIFLSGRPYNKYLSNKYYGLNKVEKMSENLLGKNENKIKTYDKLIYEIESSNNYYQKVNFKEINQIISLNNDNRTRKLISKLKKILI